MTRASQDRLEHEKLSHLAAADEQRQSFALEKGATARRYQTAIAELNATHEAAIRKVCSGNRCMG